MDLFPRNEFMKSFSLCSRHAYQLGRSEGLRFSATQIFLVNNYFGSFVTRMECTWRGTCTASRPSGWTRVLGYKRDSVYLCSF